MALKRINKELTDLGRCVALALAPAHLAVALQNLEVGQHLSGVVASSPQPNVKMHLLRRHRRDALSLKTFVANECFAVIRRRHARQAQLAKIWYVVTTRR